MLLAYSKKEAGFSFDCVSSILIILHHGKKEGSGKIFVAVPNMLKEFWVRLSHPKLQINYFAHPVLSFRVRTDSTNC